MSNRKLFLTVIKIYYFTHNLFMTYFNYHAKAKNLIKNGHCIAASIFKEYHHIRPALVFYFDNCKPIPIREYMWKDYFSLIAEFNIKINNEENLPFLN